MINIGDTVGSGTASKHSLTLFASLAPALMTLLTFAERSALNTARQAIVASYISNS